jgi:hypothetical protein
VGDGHLRQQQGRVDGLGRARAQHGGEDGAGGDVDGDGEFGPGQAAVVEEGEDVQAGGVDLDLFTGPQRRGGGEGPSVDSVACDGAGTVLGPCRSSRIWLISGNRPLMVPRERPRRRRSASRTAATTRSSARPVGLEARVVRWSSSPHRPCLR